MKRIKALEDWDKQLSNTDIDLLQQRLSRRTLLLNSLRAGATIMAWPGISLAELSSADTADLHAGLKQPLWKTLSVVQQHLFPADGNGPDASAIRAADYLYLALQLPRNREDASFIYQGVDWLDQASEEQYQTTFLECTAAQQVQMLQRIAGSRAGENWLSTLMTYLMEALLADPAYGGNPDGIGWAWLEHQPGFPTPPRGKRYFELT